MREVIHLDAFYSYCEQLTIKQPACYAMGNTRLLKGLQAKGLPVFGIEQPEGQQGKEQGNTCGYVQTGITPFHALFFVASSEKYATKKRSSGMERFVAVRWVANGLYSSTDSSIYLSCLTSQLSN